MKIAASVFLSVAFLAHQAYGCVPCKDSYDFDIFANPDIEAIFLIDQDTNRCGDISGRTFTFDGPARYNCTDAGGRVFVTTRDAANPNDSCTLPINVLDSSVSRMYTKDAGVQVIVDFPC